MCHAQPMGILDSLRGKQPAPPSIVVEPPLDIADDGGIVFSPQDSTQAPRPHSLPADALWIFGRSTRRGANESSFPQVFQSLSVGTWCAVELTRGRRTGWRKPIAVSLDGASVGVCSHHPIRDQFGRVAKVERRVFAPAMVENVNGKKSLLIYMCSDTDLAAWLHVHRKTADADYVPPTVEQDIGKDGVHYVEARALLRKRERHTFRAKFSLEEVASGEHAGQSAVVLTVRGKRAAELSPSQRGQMPELFEIAERDARGALTLGVSSSGELWGHIAAY